MAGLLFNGTGYVSFPKDNRLVLSQTDGWTLLIKMKYGTNTGNKMESVFVGQRDGALLNYLETYVGQDTAPNSWERNRFVCQLRTDGGGSACAAAGLRRDANAAYFVRKQGNTLAVGRCSVGGSVQKTTKTNSQLFNLNIQEFFLGYAGNLVSASRIILGSGREVKEFGLVSRLMSDADIQSYANGTSFTDIAGADLFGFAPLDEGAGTSVDFDVDVTPVVGTISGGLTWIGGSGQVPQGTATIGSITAGQTTASVPFTYTGSDATEFDLYIDSTYHSTTASSPASAAGLDPETTYNAVIVPVNATGDGTPSAVVQFTTQAAAGQVPQGTVTIGSITVGETTATVPYSYNDTDQTGFEYRLSGGSAQADADSPVDLTGLTENTAYTIEVRAVNGNGPGAWSAVGNFTTNAAVADPVIVFGADTALAFNTGGAAGLRPNLTNLDVDIYDVATRALVLSVTGHTTGADAVLANIQNAALEAATEYRIVVLGQDGSEAVFRETSQ